MFVERILVNTTMDHSRFHRLMLLKLDRLYGFHDSRMNMEDLMIIFGMWGSMIN